MFMPIKDAVQPAKIKIMGVGGAGGNAINRMISYGFAGVDFIAVNTDLQILSVSQAEKKIQIGKSIAKGLGVGGNPEVGRKAADEAKDEIKNIIEGTDMLFITAGMGGGTGTGASPIIAEIAKELGVLVISIVTKPFQFEGKKRMKQAREGIELLKTVSDTTLIIPNERLNNICDKSTPLINVFEEADNILYQAAKGISDIIITPGLINRDFADVKTVMSYRGDAVIGTGEAKGESKGASAAQIALDCPILEDSSIEGASALLVSIAGPKNLSIGDINEAMTIITERAGEDAEVLFGAINNENLDDEIRLTIVATGINKEKQEKTSENIEALGLFEASNNTETLSNNTLELKRTQIKKDDIDTPTYLRRAID